MTAILAAIGRVVLGAVLALTAIAAMLWAWAGPQGWPVVAFLLVLCTVIVAAGLGLSALHPKGENDGR